nr:nuclear pore complex protein Nup98-Nup96 isoform X3 [Danaus plexippus plexippus]
MFQKQTFGAANTGFGSFNAGASTSSPFSGFKPAASTSGFGAAPAFGATAAQQPATGGGLFGSTNTSGGLFGGTTSTSSGFGSSGFGFGGTSSGGLFNNTSGGLFANNQNTSAFGAKPATGFGFGAGSAPAPSGGLFGSQPSTSTGIFGQQNNTLGTGLFINSAGGFGQQAQGTAHVKYNPVVGTDVVVKSGSSQNVNIKHHCITCMKDYESKSLEELRLEDYVAGRKGASGVFGFQQTENKPLFGTSSTFGQPATTSAPSLFGSSSIGSAPAFGQTNTFSFGGGAQPGAQTTGLFGANKPAFGATTNTGTSLFSTTTTQAPAFGTATSTFGFGANTQNQPGGLFNSKPATTGFGSTPSSGFGGFGTGMFAKTNTTTASFGTTTPAFGSTGFGTNTSGSSLFGNNTFGKPATTTPSFGFNTQPTLGLGGGLGSSFQSKPANSGFGTLGGTGSLFQQPAQNTFRTDSGVGGGLFNNTLGSLGATQVNNASVAGAPLGGSSNVHEQILTLVARPYDTPLFKDLAPDTATSTEEVLKPTNPSAVRAVLDSYKVSPNNRTRVTVRPGPHKHDKKSLFDGLEEGDASVEDKLTTRPSRKRLVLRNRPPADRSLEESQQNGGEERPAAEHDKVDGEHTQSDAAANRHGSWLASPKNSNSWKENEKPADSEPAARLYPDLEKELPPQVPDRRASWLSSLPLRPLPGSLDAESSVRELVRGGRDKVSEEENIPPREVAPHPAGVKLTRPGYYTIPSLEEMTEYLRPDGSCRVPHLTIGRKNYGNVFYDCEIDVAGLDLDHLVHFLNKEVIIYPEDEGKPPVGSGLNRRAVVTLERVWPRDKTERRPVTEPDRLLKMDYEGKLRRVCDKHDTKFIEYRPQTGSWVFRVEHFSKYGLTDSDEEDDITPNILKRQLVDQNLQQSAAPPKPPPPSAGQQPGLGGLGGPVAPATSGPGLSGSGAGPAGPGLTLGLSTTSVGRDEYMEQTSLNLLNGTNKGFTMDFTEDGDQNSLYQDGGVCVKSPTSELARLEHRGSHRLQLMKASLYADGAADMMEEVSSFSGDQLVPHAAMTSPHPTSDTIREVVQTVDSTQVQPEVSEVMARPITVHPHTVVLKYHKKIPPFRETIAGRMSASSLVDLSVSRARLSRWCGRPGVMVVHSTTAAADHLPPASDLGDLGLYVSGRAEHDWSDQVLLRVAFGAPEGTAAMECLSRQLNSLLECSDTDTTRPICPRLVVRQEPLQRRRLLAKLLEHAKVAEDYKPKFGVSGQYCVQVWKLCEALWGLDLENDGVPGNTEQYVVSQHQRLVEWLKEVVQRSTDEELEQPGDLEDIDEYDAHSSKVWWLVVGGRILEACKLARDKGDLNMAAIITQASGDPAFKSLLERQLRVWRECGAEGLVAESRRATISLLAGLRPRGYFEKCDWLRVLLAVACYICPQVPTLEQILHTYESYLTDDEMSVQHPRPAYQDRYDARLDNNPSPWRDLRYELLKARATQSRPRTDTHTYTPDTMDCSLSFLVGSWLGVSSSSSVTGTAEQLEAAGSWHLAVQVLAYLPDDTLRGHLIRQVLNRNAPSKFEGPVDEERLALMKRLRIPHTWLLAAQAWRAKYEHKPLLQAEHLVAAQEWTEAHRVLVEELLTGAVLSDKLSSISGVVCELSAASRQHLVRGWSPAADALTHYLRLCEEIREVVNAGGAAAGDGLKALRPSLTAACRALAQFEPRSPKQAAAHSEMGARLVQLSLAGGRPAPHMAALLAALRLPPDCAAAAATKIATDLAERASEVCLESAVRN